MRKLFYLFITLVILIRYVTAEPLIQEETESPYPITLGLAEAFPAAAAGINLAKIAIPEIQGAAPWIANPLLLGSHIPLYWHDAKKAGAYTALGLGLPTAGISLMFLPGGDPVLKGQWSGTILQTYANLMHFSVYETWRHTRVDAGIAPRPGEDRSVLHLAASPFTHAAVDPLSWVPSLIGPAALTAWYLYAEHDGARSVYESGHGYVGSNESPIWSAGACALLYNSVNLAAVALGEEAYYRGVVYEQIRLASGQTAAMLTDAVLFPLIHLPGDLQAGFKPETIAFNALWRCAMTMIFDLCYEKGGLPLSISAHFWSDLVLRMSQWCFYGGSLE